MVDLGRRYELRAIATQGRRMPPDHVTEYLLQYSDDGEGWRTYTSQAGEEEVLFCFLDKILFYIQLVWQVFGKFV